MNTSSKYSKTVWIISTIAMFVTNWLSIYLPINGVSTSQISDTLHTLITPVGFTFSIWSIIYIGVIYVGYLYIRDRITISIGGRLAYIISCISNIAWIIAWHHSSLHLSMILIICLLVSLMILYQNISKNINNNKYNRYAGYSILLYIGRVQIATLLMTTVYIQYARGLIDISTLWRPIAILIIAVLLNIYILYKLKSITTSLVAIRALYGIYASQTTDIIQTTSLISIIALILSILTSYIYHHKFTKIGKTLSSSSYES